MKVQRIFSGHLAAIETASSVAIVVISIMGLASIGDGGAPKNSLALLIFLSTSSLLGSAFFSLQFVELDWERNLLTIRNFKSFFFKVTVPLKEVHSIEWRPWQSMSNGVMDLLFLTLIKSNSNKNTELIILNERLGAVFGESKSNLFLQIGKFATENNPKIEAAGLFLGRLKRPKK